MKKNKVLTFSLIFLVAVLSSQVTYASTNDSTNNKENFLNIAQADGDVRKDSVDRANELISEASHD